MKQAEIWLEELNETLAEGQKLSFGDEINFEVYSGGKAYLFKGILCPNGTISDLQIKKGKHWVSARGYLTDNDSCATKDLLFDLHHVTEGDPLNICVPDFIDFDYMFKVIPNKKSKLTEEERANIESQIKGLQKLLDE